MSDWVRDGGRLCLDLVNTLRDRYGGGRELLVSPDLLADWLREVGLLADGRPSDAHLASAVALREAIDRAVLARADRAIPAGPDVELINAAARGENREALQLRVGRDGSVAAVRPQPRDPVRAALAAVAVDAIELLATEPFPRVAVCAFHRCGLRFLDTSPARNRQWCSMARCGNRAKARQHYARRRAGA
ncbi:CGNR zinc finger domain-containing protein [Saccharopolyspora hordei]|uniref:Putative RNA-binding Zn ribbon-like protein n=1 Tax=Saccharopolyspora hordei TaxID=1838 RepID=A0A853ARH9_9PSEU|nr:ABATE domain-containing protein [Saccharopolyspora hordei]NYI83807.1 putative RNA-binding Zn ribbon-like protein [Saccharopolyspora hordei]